MGDPEILSVSRCTFVRVRDGAGPLVAVRHRLCAPCNFVSGISDVTSHYNLTSEPRGQFRGKWNIRRSYEVQEGPDHLRWFCGEAEFEASWEAWKAWAKMEEAPWRALHRAARLEPADFTKSLLDTG